ncbi:ABC transporter ATP-binding protein [Actinophytocola sediminis]
MHDGSGRIVVQNLTKNFGQVAAVQNLSFQVEPGSVTGFLGPNGAGKTTTLRMVLGLVAPTAGWSTINGQPFHQLGNPGRVVGAVLEAQGFHPTRTARDHLRVYCAAMGVPEQRADEVLNLVGLGTAATRSAGGFSLGMKQRLALATALIGDPQVLVLDEPANGLDPEGIAWLRTFLKAYAASGRTVLISSHLLAEVEQTIDQVVIISHGQTMYYGHLDELRKSQQSRVIVQPNDPAKLVAALQEEQITNVTPLPDNRVAVVGATVQQIGDIAAKAGVALYGVQEERADLEQLFFSLTSGQYSAPGVQAPPPGYGPPPGGGYAQPVPQQGFPQQPYQQQPGYGTPPPGYQQPGQQSGYNTPPPGFQQPGQQSGYHTPPPGFQQQPPQATPPAGWDQQSTPPAGWGQAPGTPPNAWGPPQQQQQPPQQQPPQQQPPLQQAPDQQAPLPPQQPPQQPQQQPPPEQQPQQPPPPQDQQPGQGGTGGNA